MHQKISAEKQQRQSKNNSSKSNKNQIYEQDFKEQQKQKVFSEFYKTQYEPMMAGIDVPSVEMVTQILKNGGIIYRQNQQYAAFTKHCIKTDWESTCYRVKYGKFQTNLRVIKSKLNPRQICRQILKQGSFGLISIFQLSKGVSYALKNIKIKPGSLESINAALTEVFLAKILSTLQVGPKFSQILSYDAILYEDSVHFAMEVCRIVDLQSKMKKQIKQKALLKSLKLMHNLQICHLDIKYENIGWSATFKKFVFLDFGLSMIVNEPIGKKTLTQFRGTYTCCSPDMKKLLLLKNMSYIDLYYNDLYSLQWAWKEMGQSQYIQQEKISQMQQMLSQLFIKEFVEPQPIKNEAIVRYFKVKLNYFQRNFQVVEDLMSNEQILLRTFARMIKVYQQNKHFKSQFKECLKKLEQKINKNKEGLDLGHLIHKPYFDQILYEYQVQNKEKIETNQNLKERIQQIAESDSLFGQVWQDYVWKQHIFFSIDVYSNQAINFEPFRFKLIEKIFKKQISAEIGENSILIKFRQVLLYYAKLFEEKKNVIVLENMLTYFILMGDDWNRQNIQGKILHILEEQGRYSQCLMENLKYFLGKILVTNRVNFSFARNNIKKIQKLIFKLKVDENSPLIFQKFEATSAIMKKILEARQKKIGLNNYYKVSDQIRNYLKFIENELNVQVERFIDIVIIGTVESSILTKCFSPQKKIQIKNQYLEANLHIIRIMSTSDKVEKVDRHRKLLNSDQFTRQFVTILHFPVLSNYSEPDLSIKRTLCKDFLKININQHESVLNLQFWQCMVIGESLETAFDFCQAFLEKYQPTTSPLSFPFDTLLFLHNITTSFFTFKSKLPQNIFKQKSIALSKFVSPLLQSIQKFAHQQNQKDEKVCKILGGSENQNIFYKWYICKVYFCLFLEQQLEAYQLLLEMIDKDNGLMFKATLLYLFCYIKSKIRINEESKLVSQTILNLTTNIFEKKDYQLIITVPLLLFQTLVIYLQNGSCRLAFLRLKQLCFSKWNSCFPPFFLELRNFVNSLCPISHLHILVQEESKYKLIQIAEYSKLTYLLGLACFKMQKQVDNVSLPLVRRLIIICVMFAQQFTEGSFRSYKYKLFKEAEKCQKLEKKIKNIRKLTRYEHRKLSLKQTFKAIERISEKKKGQLPSIRLRQKLLQVIKTLQLQNKVK